jgi:uncharacterized repeat protein (TIGR03847 family)
MPEPIDIKPVTHITADAIGQPGKRVFYIQGQQDARTFTLVTEKFQVQSLSIGIEQFLADITEKFPDLSEASHDYVEDNMRIHPPVDPLYRAGELALGYDVDNDLVILVVKEILADEQDPEDGRVIRFWCSRDQIRALAHWGLEVVSRGRPLCPQCGAPMDDEATHFCPKKNGHRDD